MSSLKGGKKDDVTTVVTTDKKEDVTTVVTYVESSVSKHDVDGSVMSSSPWSLRLNMYQKDVIEAAADQMNLSKQAYIRLACIEYAIQNLGIK